MQPSKNREVFLFTNMLAGLVANFLDVNDTNAGMTRRSTTGEIETLMQLNDDVAFAPKRCR